MASESEEWVAALCKEIEADIERERDVILGVCRPTRDADYCDQSFLPPATCAHCLGHVLDPDLEEAAKL